MMETSFFAESTITC